MSEKALLEKANLEFKKKNFQEAKKYFKEILALKPKVEQYWLSYILSHINLKEFEKAELLSLEALDINDNFEKIHCNLGIIFQINGKFDEALKSFKKAISINRNYLLAYNSLGILFNKLKRYSEAINFLKIAITIDNKNIIANLEIGNSYYNQKDFYNAEIYYRKVIELNPNILEVKLNLALTLKEIHKFDEAEKISKELIKIRNNYFKIYYCLSSTLLEKGRTNLDYQILLEAENYARKAIKLNNKYTKSYLVLSIILAELGNLNESLTWFEEAIKLSPDDKLIDINYKIILKQKKLIDFLQNKKKEKNIIFNNNKKNYTTPLILFREVEKELLSKLYEINSNKIINTQGGPLYGEGKTSDYNLFDDNSDIIKKLSNNLIKILKKEFKTDIFIIDSFFNILNINSGSIRHNHINNFDKRFKLIDNKYSLTYYISVGDQKCKDPGFFKVYDPIEQILPSNGTIILIPATRDHSSLYSGSIDRVMIGVNFYSIS